MKCLESRQEPQCTGLVPGESEEEQGLEEPHRAQSLHVVQTVPPVMQPERRRIRWPQACKTTEWQKFDEDVDKVLEATAKGNAERRLQTITTLIVSMAVERFGVEEVRGVTKPYTKNQRVRKIHNIRIERCLDNTTRACKGIRPEGAIPERSTGSSKEGKVWVCTRTKRNII